MMPALCQEYPEMTALMASLHHVVEMDGAGCSHVSGCGILEFGSNPKCT